MITITINTTDGERAAAAVRQRIAGLDFTALLRGVARDFETLHGQYSDAEAGPAGAWPELAPATVKRKGFTDILVETGRLRESLASRTHDSIRELDREPGKASLRFGTTRPYAGLHQRGSSRVPARVHVGIREAEAKVIARRVASEVVRQLTNRQPAAAA